MSKRTEPCYACNGDGQHFRKVGENYYLDDCRTCKGRQRLVVDTRQNPDYDFDEEDDA